ncbi:MAG TPA: 2OG-Fe(II) oxygenase [Candidatus Acidoferrum sp.]|nr:2OG-Fe(II) oxygenase [Candidatus Acidoferrum sp.]
MQIAAVPSGLKSSLGVKVGGLRPTLETHFGVRLDGCESLQFLTYSPGHFYGPHTDSTDDAEAPALIRRRKVSVVIFVNASCVAGDANGYDGGELVFYGLIKAPRFSACGLPLEAQAGMLIAFPADVVHEVRPVILGHRLTIATWFAVARD